MNKIIFLLAYSVSCVCLASDYSTFVGVFSSQNGKASQEDKARVASLADYLFLGVYDGHGGKNTAKALKKSFHIYLAESLNENDPQQALIDTFKKVDEYAVKNCSDGSTATI